MKTLKKTRLTDYYFLALGEDLHSGEMDPVSAGSTMLGEVEEDHGDLGLTQLFDEEEG